MKVSPDAAIEVEIPPPVPAVPQPEEIPLDVIYEDESMIVVDKRPGMVVHPAPGHHGGTLVNALLARCPDLAGIGGVARPGIVHRLDMDTSGLVAVAKTPQAMVALVRAFSSHSAVEKTYLALCHGRPRLESGRIENLIGRHPADRKKMAVVEKNGKNAVTNWNRVSTDSSRGSPVSLMRCKIETGRTHQIRVHMALLGTPVIGDAVYGSRRLDRLLDPEPVRQMLHAWRLSLRHPATGRPLSFEAPVPADMLVYASPQTDLQNMV